MCADFIFIIKEQASASVDSQTFHFVITSTIAFITACH